MESNRRKYYLTAILIWLIISTIGFFLYDDYGVAYDDVAQHTIASVNYNYVTDNVEDGIPELKEFKDRYYGVAFELPLAFIERDILHLDYKKREDFRQIILLRHYLTNIFFAIGCAFFFLFLAEITDNYWVSFIGVIILILTPRIFAHAFFNVKDIPFMSMYMLSMWAFIRYFKGKGFYQLLVLMVCSSLLVNVRIMGVLFVVISLVFMSWDFIKRRQPKLFMTHALVYTLGFSFILLLTWPVLWENPITEFYNAIKSMSHFQWDDHVLYGGHQIRATNLPWHYSFIWITITTPIVYLLLFALGSFKIVRDSVNNKFKLSRIDYAHLMLICTVFGTLFSVIALKSTLYDGWRQLYYIYPSVVAIGIVGLNGFLQKFEKSKWVYVPVFLLGITFVQIAFFMVRNHPYQHVYFNELVPRSENWIRKHFELDYWGVSYREGLEFIARETIDSKAKVFVKLSHPQFYNTIILSNEDYSKFQFTQCIDSAEYVMENYRFHPQDFDYQEEVYGITVNNSKILSVFRK